MGVSSAQGGTTSGGWTAWHIEREMSLPAGAHPIQVQMSAWNGSTTGCTVDTSSYDSAKLWVEAR